MNDLFFQLRNICNHNRDGSYVTQKNRLTNLELFSKQLHEMGFRRMKATSLREKHVYALVNRWLTEAISPKTIHNRMSFLRWWAQKIGKTNVVHSNSRYGIPKRDQSNAESKAQTLDNAKLDKFKMNTLKPAYSCKRLSVYGGRNPLNLFPAMLTKGIIFALRQAGVKAVRREPYRFVTQNNGQHSNMLKP